MTKTLSAVLAVLSLFLLLQLTNRLPRMAAQRGCTSYVFEHGRFSIHGICPYRGAQWEK